MRIIDGKWQDKYGQPVDNFNVTELMQIGEKVTALYNEDITYDRISLVASLGNLDSKQESLIAELLQDNRTISKLAGY